MAYQPPSFFRRVRLLITSFAVVLGLAVFLDATLTRIDAAHVGIKINLDHLLLDRQMTLTELAERVDVTIVNLSILKTNKAKAIRFSTLEALCKVLECQPGDLLEYVEKK